MSNHKPKPARLRFRKTLAFMGALLLLPIAAGLWVARGDPDVRPEQHRAYLESINGLVGDTAPNVVVVLADDLGYGDLSSFGSKAIQTPNLDALAAEGVKLTNFYSASPVCSPSRFSLLTGRYSTRGFIHSVFFPSGTALGLYVNTFGFPRGIRGIPEDEITVAEALLSGGYSTGMFGKWHLGDRSPHLPTDKGFSYFYGSYYSNDMEPYAYYRNGEVAIEAPADQSTLTKVLTREVTEFIDRHRQGPFFVYYASPFPHHPVHASDDFAGRSQAGAYGDCVEELDWSIGEIRKKLAESGIARNTLFVFSSDNGPWYQGSPGMHRGRKKNSFEGGQTVPFIAAWPERIPAGSEVATPAMSIDLFATILTAAGLPLPTDRIIDGKDLSKLLAGEPRTSSARSLFFVSEGEFVGVRVPHGLKYLVKQKSENSAYWLVDHGPFLFDLRNDPTESYDISARLPKEADRLAGLVRGMNEASQRNPRGWVELR